MSLENQIKKELEENWLEKLILDSYQRSFYDEAFKDFESIISTFSIRLFRNILCSKWHSFCDSLSHKKCFNLKSLDQLKRSIKIINKREFWKNLYCSRKCCGEVQCFYNLRKKIW